MGVEGQGAGQAEGQRRGLGEGQVRGGAGAWPGTSEAGMQEG